MFLVASFARTDELGPVGDPVLGNQPDELRPSVMTFALWTLDIGAQLITMVLSSTLLNRLPLSNAMLYLATGFVLGTARWAILTLNQMVHAGLLERTGEVAVLISLFSVGLKLDLLLSNWQWLRRHSLLREITNE
jgi:NhaP-type Na+/H+ or K+/H+ antiporter